MSDDGGPAFPIPDDTEYNGCRVIEGSYGMSLRDWFAGRAMTVLTATCTGDTLRKLSYPQHVAELSYEMADAMLAARAAPTPQPQGDGKE